MKWLCRIFRHRMQEVLGSPHSIMSVCTRCKCRVIRVGGEETWSNE